MIWIKYFFYKLFKKTPEVKSIDDFRFWNNKLFKDHKEDYDEDSDYLH
jgi:hypothetical protein